MTDIQILRQSFFNIISQLVQKEQESEMLEVILKEVASFVNAEFISAYIQFEEHNFYRLIRSYRKSGQTEPVTFIHHTEKKDINNFFKKEWNVSSIHTLQFTMPSNDQVIIVIKNDEALSSKLLTNLEKECEKVFAIIGKLQLSEFNNETNQFLLNVSTKLMKSNDRHIVLTEIVQSLNDIFPEFPYYVILTQEYDDVDHLPIKFMEYTDESDKNIATEAFMSGEMRTVNNEAGKKVIYAPLVGEQSVYGVLEITVPEKEIIRKDQLSFTHEFAMLAGKALEKTILYENSLVQVNNLTLLHEVIHQLNSSRQLTEITGIVRQKVISISNAEEVGFIYHNEAAEQDFEVLNGSTYFFYQKKGKEISRKLKEMIDEVPDDIFSGDYTSIDLGEYHSLMVFPMVHSGMSPGFIVVLSKEKYFFTFENFKLIKTLIQHSSLAMANTILQQQLELTVITDYLTKLYSRKYLEEQTEENLRTGKRGVLLLFDIDDFKKINDEHGHHIGDVVLKQVARTLMKIVGKKGIAARWGGEELAVYLPDMNVKQGTELAESIRSAVSQHTDPNVTISCGVASWELEDHTTVQSLFLEADNALYEAKTAGKNRVIINSKKTSL